MIMENEVLLSVQNLQQYFKSGKFENKAVDGVSFDIYKGEVFGLVGESGCGKTTTGRSIIRLYDITGGSVYYKGERICAGTRSYKDAIAKAKKDYADKKISREELNTIIAENRAEIKKATEDHKKWSRRKGQNQLTNEIQMIFQDPIASLDPRMTVRDIIAEGLIIRGVKDQEFIEAARSAGASDARIIFRYIVPNALSPMIVQVTMGMASAVLSIASLSFIGMGIQAPMPEWGAMLSNARTYIRDAWHITVMPGAAIMITILILNIIGDGLRDALDPRMKN